MGVKPTFAALAAALSAHDASSGFHDIKALPEFRPLPLTAMALAAAAIILAALGYWLKRRRRNAPRPSAPEPTPEQAAEAELAQLARRRDSGEAELRSFCADLSLCLRRYLERRLGFPATDQTTREVNAAVPRQLARVFPALARGKIDELQAAIRAVLRFCERSTYADDAEERLSTGSVEVQKQLDAVKEIVAAIYGHYRLERDRAASVAGKTPAPEKNPAQHAGNKHAI